MKNIMKFENGISHEFTDVEMRVLKRAIRETSESVVEGTEEMRALQNLISLFLEHLD